jgi:hypothetical protein
MISPGEKLPTARFWQLATSATGNFPARKAVSHQHLAETVKLPVGTLATSLRQLGNFKRSFDLRDLRKLPDCQNPCSPYGRDERAPIRRARPSRPLSSTALATTLQPVSVAPLDPTMAPLGTDPLRPGRGPLLALDLGTTTGWALRLVTGQILHGSVSFRPSRFDGGGMRFVRFSAWLDTLITDAGSLEAIYFEEVRRHLGVDAAHLYGGFLATLTAWCDHRAIAYQGVPVGTIKRHATAKGNAGKDAVIAAVTARGFSPKDDNEADAIALLLWAVETKGGVR